MEFEGLPSRFMFDQNNDRIGSGTFGTVFKAFDNEFKKIVAIKVVRKDPKTDVEYEDEAKFLKTLQHPFIVSLYSFEEYSNFFLFSMELATGGSLKDLLKTKVDHLNRSRKLRRLEGRGMEPPLSSCMDTDFIGNIFVQILEAVIFLHSRALIHRDIKPDNILFIDPGHNLIKLGDFGTCCLSGSKSQQLKIGTPAYMAPDGFAGDVSEKFDCWSLGVVLFEMFELRRPFELTTTDDWKNYSDLEYTHLRQMPEHFTDLISKLICDPSERISSKDIRVHPAISPYYRNLLSLTI